MIYYVQKRPPVVCIDLEGNHTAERFSFDKAISYVATGLIARQAVDTLSLIDVRARVLAAKELEYVPVEGDVHTAIVAEFQRSKVFGSGYLLAAADHIRAWTEAPNKPPASAVIASEPPTTNGKASKRANA